MKRILSYPLSVIFYLLFGLTLVIFHLLQWLGVTLGGAKAHRGVINIMNLCLLRCLHALGVTFSFKNQHDLPKNKPLIIVSNHQSMFDIPLISWYLRRHKPKFISKIELGKGIPSISFNLRHGGHVLIDRKNPKQSIPALSKFGKYIAEHNFAAVIFPEGTRSKDGNPKEFAATGLKILFKNAPEALVVPVTINNSWKLVKYGNFPMGIGIHLTLEVQEPISIDKEPELLIKKIEERVTLAIRN
ncbi:1-acyl-sn-glycerol-3-phosphate acyltransferase [Aquimarina sp. AD10]|uniref:Glycerol acyltransferase n=1 Tax=Aquimarina aggregata TaxID=1642818 RepID=A0A162WQU4_9FLAO|nr:MULTISPECIES: lysophospholipid acyltransferase family protein [Aquimarina]AXT63678.1 1-acyl-sn-glycerol-3-phosphate acyltransferase [Aquimarina sp. AD10]KZS38251.1 glycerol acyltransferase [Aquimarina aggregata]RKM90088.1 1-acyl-sn-glycerol-3-phosphate acyltransferase [Aquimarina sp. AD10]